MQGDYITLGYQVSFYTRLGCKVVKERVDINDIEDKEKCKFKKFNSEMRNLDIREDG